MYVCDAAREEEELEGEERGMTVYIRSCVCRLTNGKPPFTPSSSPKQTRQQSLWWRMHAVEESSFIVNCRLIANLVLLSHFLSIGLVMP